MSIENCSSYSFTCCDFEPAVLARNVVLLTLIIDSSTSNTAIPTLESTIWNIFYHFYIPSQDLVILHSHLKKLCNASESYDSWRESPYGKYIKYIDRSTLAHLRNYWTQYGETGYITKARNKQAREAIGKRSKEIGDNSILNGIRAAGPAWLNASQAVPKLYQEFWKTGVAGGNPEDKAQLGGGCTGEVNPLFAVSSAPSKTFAVHYGAEPLVNFHVAEAFHGLSPSAQTVVDVAKSQFKQWCGVFSELVKQGRVTLRLFHGDALAFCYHLQLFLQNLSDIPRNFRKAWSSELLEIDGDCPKERFHVIDTSNLSDHVGMINMFSAAAPLLCWDHICTLYTENLLLASEDTSATLTTLLGSDVTTFALLVGLSPCGSQSNVTLDAIGNEAVLSARNSGRELRQFRMRVTWKHLASGDLLAGTEQAVPQITFEHDSLALYLFSIYRKMFALEDITQFGARTDRMATGKYSIDQARYTRAAFASLLKLVISRVSVEDWSATIRIFLDHVEKDRTLLVGSNSLQELYMYLHLFSIWTTDALSVEPRILSKTLLLGLRQPSEDTGHLASSSLPSVARMVLIVPRGTA